jgi:tetratricopeptide (TPR) repeat protein
MTIARLFEQSGRIRKAQKWFERALAINSRFGDVYIYYFAMMYVITYKVLLLEEGNQQLQDKEENDIHQMDGIDDDDEDVENAKEKGEGLSEITENVDGESEKKLHEIVKRCVEAEPNQGELWCSFIKQTVNRRKPFGTLLLLSVENCLNLPLKFFAYSPKL